MFRHTVLVLVLIFLTGPALGEDRIEVPCKKAEELEGRKMPCHVFPVLKYTKSQYAALLDNARRRECRAKWKAEFSHCRKYGRLWSDAPPPECVGNTSPKC